jgi:hypothetical protein
LSVTPRLAEFMSSPFQDAVKFPLDIFVERQRLMGR